MMARTSCWSCSRICAFTAARVRKCQFQAGTSTVHYPVSGRYVGILSIPAISVPADDLARQKCWVASARAVAKMAASDGAIRCPDVRRGRIIFGLGRLPRSVVGVLSRQVLPCLAPMSPGGGCDREEGAGWSERIGEEISLRFMQQGFERRSTHLRLVRS
jgi:hypothetical protein